jgi:hypothetical protein
MGYICMECYEEYDIEALNGSLRDEYGDINYLCPKKNCNEFAVVEIDDMILPIIRKLNQKGYITRYCCSGHSYDLESCNTYIGFIDEDCVPQALPKGFELEKPNGIGLVCIRKRYDDYLGKLELHEEICKTMIDLIDWVNKLDYCEW